MGGEQKESGRCPLPGLVSAPADQCLLERRFNTVSPEISYLSLSIGNLEAGSGSPKSHVVPSWSMGLCQPFSSAQTLVSTTHGPPEPSECNDFGSPRTQKPAIGLQGMKCKFFSCVFHTFTEMGPTSFPGFVHFFIHVCNKWECLLSARHASNLPGMGPSCGEHRRPAFRELPVRVGLPDPRLFPTHLWGHHARLLLRQDTGKHSLAAGLPLLASRSTGAVGLWGAAL